MEIIAKGAEANLYMSSGVLVKERIAKKYRVSELDLRLRRSRTKREARYLEKAADCGVNVPQVFRVDEKKCLFEMQYVVGKTLKETFSVGEAVDLSHYCGQIGFGLRRLHDAGLIHNDLTTSNMLLSDGQVYFIDFGLAHPSFKVEDKAMDLVVFKKSLMATHPSIWGEIWDVVISSYAAGSELLKRIEVIEKRVRYS